MQNQVSFGSDSQNKRSFFGTLGDSIINVGMTAGVGALAGGTCGKIASLTPYKPNAAAINAQLNDMFISSSNSTEIPKYLENKSKDILDIVKKGQSKQLEIKNLYQHSCDLASLAEQTENAAAESIAKPEFQETVKKLFKDTKIPEAGYTKESILDRIKSGLENTVKEHGKKTEEFASVKDAFVKQANLTKDADILDIAQKGAKHLRKQTIIGAGIGIGIIAALVINLLNMYGIIGRKKAPAQGQINQPSAAAPQIQPK